MIGPGDLPPIDRQPDADPDLLRRELVYTIEQAIANHPRSLQREIGPSEMGTPCARRLGHKLAGTPEQQRSAAWRPTVGTAVHAWLADVFLAAEVPGGGLRWLVEQRIELGRVGDDEIGGSTDLYDRCTATVVDWKIPGPSSLTAKRRAWAKGEPPEPTYRTQLHLYGLGWRRRGFPVKRVAIMALPAAGELTDAAWWSEPYDEARALKAVERADGYARAAAAMGGWDALIPHLPRVEDRCGPYCPFWRAGADPSDPSSCPGADKHVEATAGQARQQLAGLIPTP